jgi:hypothetical protein
MNEPEIVSEIDRLPSRRRTLASAGVALLALAGLGSGKAQALAPKGRRIGRELQPDQALQMLKEHGIINRDVTFERMEAVSRQLGSGGGQPWAYKWCLIVKGKFCYRDDA